MIAFVVAGTASGVGKTTVALALMAEFRERGWVVQPFKCGPDFLDPGHLSAVCGRTARNLDTWMMDSESVRAIFETSASDADVAIVEGMMGLFDGAAGGEDQGSTAAIAKLLNLPIVLVLDAAKGARSIAAVVKGFESFDPALHFAGVVLNGVSSQAHYQMLEVAIREVTATPLLGRIPKDPSITIPERYLGLHTAEERSPGAQRAQLAEIARRHLNLSPLLDLSPLLELPGSPLTPPSRKHPMVAGPGLPTKPGIRIGVARDRAFSFYYEDNFDLLRQNGAEIVFFSPLTDLHLPANLDALYLGGGYPELHADALSRNVQLGAEIGSFVDSGKPLYAECGGFIYLGSSLTLLDGTVVPMSGVLPVDFEMTTQLVQFGYVEVEFVANCLLGAAGTRLRGHSFHCSRFRSPANLPTAYRVHYSLGGQTEAEGFTYKNVLATYIHLPFRGNPGVTACLVEAARRMQAVEVRA
jgi:cobyrinic acid a,c-diamide synthase